MIVYILYKYGWMYGTKEIVRVTTDKAAAWEWVEQGKRCAYDDKNRFEQMEVE